MAQNQVNKKKYKKLKKFKFVTKSHKTYPFQPKTLKPKKIERSNGVLAPLHTSKQTTCFEITRQSLLLFFDPVGQNLSNKQKYSILNCDFCRMVERHKEEAAQSSMRLIRRLPATAQRNRLKGCILKTHLSSSNRQCLEFHRRWLLDQLPIASLPWR